MARTAEQEGASPVVGYARLPAEAVAAAEGVDPQQGLSEEEAARRLQEYGPNTVEGREVTPWRLLRRQLESALTLLLIAAAVLSLFLGDVADGALILGLVLANVALGFFQEYRATRALQELRRLIQVEARVRRGGSVRCMPARDVVPGDVVLVQAGDIVPADLRLTQAVALAANEASLTGESLPVPKVSAPQPEVTGRPTRLQNTLFTGTTVVAGRGEGIAVATGGRTYFGQTAALLRGLERPGPFQRDLNRFANILLAVGIAALVVIIAINTLLGRGLFNSFLFGLALIVGIVPEALPAVTAITLSLGAADLARHNVIVKRLSALQDLSSVTVLCTDKTGTLTSGVMRVQEVWGAPELLAEAVLATTYPARGEDSIYDAIIDRALEEGVVRVGQPLPASLKRLPFDPDRKRASHVVRRDGRAELITLGAPARVMDVSGDFSAVGSRAQAEARLQAMTDRALRVVAVAAKELPERPGYTPSDEAGLRFLGLIGMGDPVRPAVPEAIRQARRLDVEVKVLTGDNVRTAEAVARQVGLGQDGLLVIRGEDLRQGALSAQRLCATQVYAELVPEDKLRIVQGLEEAGEAVAVTGDGVNDAPALRAATVGVAMASGTAVAKEAGDLILLGDDLASLVNGIGRGREILANVSKYLLYTMPGNVGILITMVVASVVLPFLPLLPGQVLLLAILTDLPMLAISTDTVDPEDLAQPERLDIPRLVSLAGALGVLEALFSLGLVLALRGAPEPFLHTALVYELALTTFFLAPVVRSRRPLWRERGMSRPLVVALIVSTLLFVLLVSFDTPASRFVGFVALPAAANLAVVGYSALYALGAEATSAGYYYLTRGRVRHISRCKDP